MVHRPASAQVLNRALVCPRCMGALPCQRPGCLRQARRNVAGVQLARAALRAAVRDRTEPPRRSPNP